MFLFSKYNPPCIKVVLHPQHLAKLLVNDYRFRPAVALSAKRLTKMNVNFILGLLGLDLCGN